MLRLLSVITYLLVTSKHGAFAKTSLETVNLFDGYEVYKFDIINRTEERHLRRLAAPYAKPKAPSSHEVLPPPKKSPLEPHSKSTGKTTTKVVENESRAPSSRGGQNNAGSRRGTTSSRAGETNSGSRGGSNRGDVISEEVMFSEPKRTVIKDPFSSPSAFNKARNEVIQRSPFDAYDLSGSVKFRGETRSLDGAPKIIRRGKPRDEVIQRSPFDEIDLSRPVKFRGETKSLDEALKILNEKPIVEVIQRSPLDAIDLSGSVSFRGETRSLDEALQIIRNENPRGEVIRTPLDAIDLSGSVKFRGETRSLDEAPKMIRREKPRREVIRRSPLDAIDLNESVSFRGETRSLDNALKMIRKEIAMPGEPPVVVPLENYLRQRISVN